MKRVIASSIIALSVSGCVLKTGGSDERVEELLRASGPNVNFMFERQKHVGELLGFRRDSAFVLFNDDIYAVPRRALTLPGQTVDWYEVPAERGLKRTARYPQEITVEMERALLTRLGKAATKR